MSRDAANPRSKTEQTKTEQTRSRVMDAALLLFRENGFEQTTMRDIATQAGVATGAAYYYFDSKEALVMAFYHQAQSAMEPALQEVLSSYKKLEPRLLGLLQVKFDQFRPNRRLLGALSKNIDPEHPLSPFSEPSRAIREKDTGYFEQALAAGDVTIPMDLNRYLPRLLWLYQMGLILFWIYDRSPEQAVTAELVKQSLKIVVGLIKLSAFPLMRPLRRRVVHLLALMYSNSEGQPA